MPAPEKTREELISENELLRRTIEDLQKEVRLHAVRSIEDSELKLLEMIENTSEAIFVVLDGVIRFANPACSEFTGYSIEEMVSLNDFSGLIHPDDRPHVEMSFGRRSAKPAASRHLEFRLLCRDRSQKWVQIHSSLITWEDKPGILCFVTDISDRKIIEQELLKKSRELGERVKEVTCLYQISRLTQERDFQLADFFDAAVNIMPQAWQFPEVACARIVVEGDEFRSPNFGELKARQSEPIVVDSKELGFVEVGYLEQRPECEEGPFFREERQLVEAVSKTISDVISRKRSEQALRIRGRAMDTSINGIRMVYPDGTVFYTNQASADMWGYDSREEIIGRNVYDLWRDKDQLEAALNELDRKGRFLGTLTAVRKDGSAFEALLSLNQVYDERGNLVGLVASHIDITEQKLAEEDLRERELRFSAIANSVFDAIIMIDDQGEILFWNQAAEQMFGYEASEAIGKNFHLLIAPTEYHADYSRAFKNFAATGQGSTVGKITELQALTKNGKKFPVELSLSAFRMKGRWNAAGIVRDIGKRKKAEEDLRRSEERFRQVAESADEWIWEVDSTGMYTYSSPVVETILGYSADELVGKKYFYDLFLPEEAQRLKELSFSMMGQGKYFTGFINRNLKKNGDIAIIESSGVAMLDQEGNIIGCRGVDKDITDRFRSEQEYRRLFTAIESTAGSVVVTDAGGVIQYVNPAFEKITGYQSEEVIGKNPSFLASGKHDKVFYKKLWDTLTRGEVWSGVILNKKKDGSLIHEEGSISPVKDVDGKIINYVKVSRDVSKEIELQKQLIQSQKMEAIGTLAGGIAHDFNNILFAITGNTELALQAIPEDSRISSNLKRVLGAANRATDMVKQILAFSRQDKPEHQPIDITPIIKESIKFLRASIPATIEINSSVQPNLPKILGDPTQIHQVLINLSVNAAHAMRDTKGVLTISLRPIHLDHEFVANRLSVAPGDYVNLTVSDTGCGIAADVLDRIFEPYFTTKLKGEGTGFGLSIVHTIVQGHGGFVSVQSDPGRGSTFNVYLPVIQESAETQVQSRKSDTVRGGTENILVVDDEAILVDVGKSIFESLGYSVIAVSDPVEALEIFRNAPDEFDLVFTDLAMPKLPGDELTREIRSIRNDIPVIICTGLSQSLTKEKLDELGIRAVLEKPLLKKEMARVVRNVLDSK